MRRGLAVGGSGPGIAALFAWLIFGPGFPAACTPSNHTAEPVTGAALFTPTVSPYFLEQRASSPATSAGRYAGPIAPVTAVDPQQRPGFAITSPIDQPVAATRSSPREVLVFDDDFAPGWSLAPDGGMSWVYTTEYARDGRRALAVTPRQGFDSFGIVRRGDAAAGYERPAVAGLSFWLNAGQSTIALDDLAVTVWGSNARSSWTADDRSVEFPQGMGFSETRLRFLGINRSIPADTWVEVQVWLDKLRYDPPYQYVTGFSIKNDPLYVETFYLDSVKLLIADGGAN